MWLALQRADVSFPAHRIKLGPLSLFCQQQQLLPDSLKSSSCSPTAAPWLGTTLPAAPHASAVVVLLLLWLVLMQRRWKGLTSPCSVSAHTGSLSGTSTLSSSPLSAASLALTLTAGERRQVLEGGVRGEGKGFLPSPCCHIYRLHWHLLAGCVNAALHLFLSEVLVGWTAGIQCRWDSSLFHLNGSNPQCVMTKTRHKGTVCDTGIYRTPRKITIVSGTAPLTP